MAENGGWSRVVAEGLVIAVSILLALAADAWWEGVQERRLESQYLVQLAVDFGNMDDRVTGWLESEQRDLSAAVRLLEAVDSDVAFPPGDSIGSWWVQSWSSPARQVGDGLLQEMVATGSLRLIRDDSLRVRLSSFVRAADDTKDALSQIETNFTIMLGDPYFQENLGVWGMYPASVKERRGLPPGSRFRIDFERVRHDREFGNFAMRGYIYKLNRLGVVRSFQSATRDLRRSLESAARAGSP
jgi:hypothetical protein